MLAATKQASIPPKENPFGKIDQLKLFTQLYTSASYTCQHNFPLILQLFHKESNWDLVHLFVNALKYYTFYSEQICNK